VCGFEGLDVGGFEDVGVYGDAAFVVEIGTGDGGRGESWT
jgi:hypothetical protein